MKNNFQCSFCGNRNFIYIGFFVLFQKLNEVTQELRSQALNHAIFLDYFKWKFLHSFTEMLFEYDYEYYA